MTNFVDRDYNGSYTIDNIKKISVTTVQKKIYGCTEGLFQNYHLRRIVYGLIRNHNFLKEIERISFNQEEEVLDIVKDIVIRLCKFYQSDREGKADVGTDFHTLAHDYFFKSKFENVKLQQIEKEYEIRGIVPLYGEYVVHDKDTAGRCDFIGISKVKPNKPQLWIIDYKTGSENKKKELQQIATYGVKFQKMHSEYKDYDLMGLIFHTGRKITDKLVVREYDTLKMKQGNKSFKHLVELYKYSLLTIK